VLDEAGQGHGAPLRAVEQAHAHRLGPLVAVADHQDVGDLGELGVADLGLHPAARGVDLRAQAGSPEGVGHHRRVVQVPVGDRDEPDLDGCQPGRQRAGVMLQHHGQEPFDGAEQRPMDHERAVAGVVGPGVLQVESVRELEVDLQRRDLPAPSDRVADVHVDLGRVKTPSPSATR
jgi:hypothetical protein